MAFIKLENTVINTSYIVAIKLKDQTCSGEECVSILMANPSFLSSQIETASPNSCHCEWLDFTGEEADALQDYFSSFNNVIDLLPQC